MNNNNKIGFWYLFSIVTGSQIGSGVLFLPSLLAPYGFFSIIGWIISGIGAICISMVFSFLCSSNPRTGGPHVYVKDAFGDKSSFFCGWTYWIISWVSNAALVISAATYMAQLFGNLGNYQFLFLELVILFSVNLINMRGIKFSASLEMILNILKFIPLLVIPFLAIKYFDHNNFTPSSDLVESGYTSMITGTVFLTLWGFIGIESATTPASLVKNPERTIPAAIVIGTLCVSLLYIFNTTFIIGLLDREVLENSSAPYVEATQTLFKRENWNMIMSLITSLICIGTLNAWTITTGHITLGLSQDKLFPSKFNSTNSKGAPSFSLIVTTTCISCILIITSNQSFSSRIQEIIDVSVTCFLFIYLLSCLASIKLMLNNKIKKSKIRLSIASISFLFCTCIIFLTPLKDLLVSIFFVASGFPFYFYFTKNNQKNINNDNKKISKN